MDEKSTDILDGLATIRHAFMRANLDPPTVILLGKHDDGMRFLSALRQQPNWFAIAGSPSLGRPIEMADGSMWMEVEAMGIKVRWPANQYAMEDGSWSYV